MGFINSQFPRFVVKTEEQSFMFDSDLYRWKITILEIQSIDERREQELKNSDAP